MANAVPAARFGDGIALAQKLLDAILAHVSHPRAHQLVDRFRAKGFRDADDGNAVAGATRARESRLDPLLDAPHIIRDLRHPAKFT
jgi:hypothetical protein